MSIKATVVPGAGISADLVSAWSRLQRGNPALDSPFLRPEYTQSVASVRPGVQVAVLEEGNEVVGFFAYQRERRAAAFPVGYPLCDFQAIVARENAPIDPADLMRQCRLRTWHFDHLVASEGALQPYHGVTAASPFLDLRGGFEAYQKRRSSLHTIRSTMRKARKADREIGTLRLVPHTADGEILKALIRWKTASYRRMKVSNYLAPAWRVALIERLLAVDDDALSGKLSALYFGDRLVSVVLGLWSYGVLHNWFPSYDTSVDKYSPGLVHQVELIKNAEALGIRRYDLGKGDERYKGSLMTGQTLVAEGCVDLRPVAGLARRKWLRTRDWLRASPLKTPARFVARNTRWIVNMARERVTRLSASK